MTLRVFAVLTILAATVSAADQVPTNRRKVEMSTPTKVKAITIPKDAVQIDPNTYRYTDPAGKKWTYSKTPFGIIRTEDKPVSPEEAKRVQEDRARLIDATKAVEDGDSIRFERATPFGVTHWQRNKAELDEVERAVWDRELQRRAAPQGAAAASKD